MKSTNQGWVVFVARIGYSAKCLIYGVMGILIFYVAFSAANAENVSKKSVFQEILYSPFGSISLSAVVIGLACYVVWRFVQSVANPDKLKMDNFKDIMMRFFYFFSAVAYGFATYAAVKVLLGSPDDDGNKKQQIGNSIMQENWGIALVGAVGCVILVFAVIQFKHALKADFMDKFVSNISQAECHLIKLVGRIGFAGRGIVYTMAGGFFIHAAATQDPDKAGGLAKALSTLLQQPFGPWMVGLVGCGMIGFALFCGFEGRYRKT